MSRSLLKAVVLVVCAIAVRATPFAKLQSALIEKSSVSASEGAGMDFAQAVMHASEIMHTQRNTNNVDSVEAIEAAGIDAAADRIESEMQFTKSDEHKRAVNLVRKLQEAGIVEEPLFVETASHAQNEAESDDSVARYENEAAEEAAHAAEDNLAQETRSFLQHSSESELDAMAQQELLADMMAENKAAAESSDHMELEGEINEAEEFLKRGQAHFDDLIEKGLLVQAEKVSDEIRYKDFPGNWGFADQVNSLEEAVSPDETVMLESNSNSEDAAQFEDAVFKATEILHEEKLEAGDKSYLDAPVDAKAEKVMFEVIHQSDPAYWHPAALVQSLATHTTAPGEDAVFLNTEMESYDGALVELNAGAKRSLLESSAELDAAAEAETEADSTANVSLEAAVEKAESLLPEADKPHVLEETSVDRAADAVTQDYIDHIGVRGWAVADYTASFGHELDAPKRDDTVFLGMTEQMSAEATKPARQLPNVAFANPSFAPYGHAYNAQGKRDYAGYALQPASPVDVGAKLHSQPLTQPLRARALADIPDILAKTTVKGGDSPYEAPANTEAPAPAPIHEAELTDPVPPAGFEEQPQA